MLSYASLASKIKLHSFFDVPPGAVFDVVFKAIANCVVDVLFLHIILIPPLSRMKVSPLVIVLVGQNIPFKASRFVVIIHKPELVIMGDKPA
jgi:hypothetical protein